jgi:hypothetical protein
MPREIKSPPPAITVSKSFDEKHLIHFNESSHRYKMFPSGAEKGTQQVGVTTFTKGGWPTSMGLISWYKSTTAEAVFAALTVPGEGGYVPREAFWPVTEETKKDIFKAAKMADRSIAQEAADIGTICHGFAELHSLGKVAEANTLLDQVRNVEAWPLIESCVRKYLEWAAKNQGQLVMAEAVCGYVCPFHRGITTDEDECICFCGKFDRLDLVNGKLRLRDYKTSKDIFAEQFIQLGGYRPAIKTWFDRNVEELEVLRFGKDDGTFEAELIDDPKEVERFQRAAFRCRRNYNDVKFFNSDPRWAWKGPKNITEA